VWGEMEKIMMLKHVKRQRAGSTDSREVEGTHRM
jgi:hypothetical protein